MQKLDKGKPKSVKKGSTKRGSSRKTSSKKAPRKKVKTARKPAKEKKEMKELRQELKDEQEKSKDYRDKCLRALADLANYRRRVREERQSLYEASSDNLICNILPVLDSFERALDPANAKDGESFKDGIELIYVMLKAVLEREGVKEFCSVGEDFDPAKHEAVYAFESREHPAQTVINEVQKGYMRNDRLIRPARVTVSKGAPQEGHDEDERADEPETGKE